MKPASRRLVFLAWSLMFVACPSKPPIVPPDDISDSGSSYDGGVAEDAGTGFGVDAGPHAFLILGDVNASGRGELVGPVEPSDPKVWMFANDGQWKVAAEPVDDPRGQSQADPDFDAVVGHGFSLRAAKEVAAALGERVNLLPAAKGGATLSSWLPSDAGLPDETTLLGSAVRRVARSEASAPRAVWYYGNESSIAAGPRASWVADFSALAMQLRRQWPTIPVIYAQLARRIDPSAQPDQHLAAELQRRMESGSGFPEEVTRHHMVVTFDLGLLDDTSLDAASQRRLGERFARATLQHVYGLSVNGTGPRLVVDKPAVFVGTDRSKIRVQFNKPILPATERYNDLFSVVLGDGSQATLTSAARDPADARAVLLQLSAPVVGRARLSYGDRVPTGAHVLLGDAVRDADGLPSPTFGPIFVTDSTLVGAIRWDAWTGDHFVDGGTNDNLNGLWNEHALGPAQWRDRLPFFGASISDQEVVAKMVRQQDMDAEIDAAQGALDYWAFLDYPAWHPVLWPMHRALSLYLSSSRSSAIAFTVILNPVSFAGWSDARRAVHLDYWADPRHVRVAGNRPLVFLFNPSDILAVCNTAFCPGDAAHLKAELVLLGDLAQARGLARPYFVVMSPAAATAGAWADQLGADAISAYAVNMNPGAIANRSYQALTDATEQLWDQFSATGHRTLPIVMAGWDPRPRIECAPPADCNPRWDYPATAWWEQGADVQVAGQVRDAVAWVLHRPEATTPNAVVAYAWNEFSEGGWLAPIRTVGEGRLRSIESVRTGRLTGEVLVNGDFEGAFRQWSPTGATTLSSVTTRHRTGISSVRLAGRTAGTDGISQDITSSLLAAGQGSYHFGVWAAFYGASTGLVRVRIVLIDASGTRSVAASQTATNTWTQVASAAVSLSWSQLSQALFVVDTPGASNIADLTLDDATVVKQ